MGLDAEEVIEVWDRTRTDWVEMSPMSPMPSELRNDAILLVREEGLRVKELERWLAVVANEELMPLKDRLEVTYVATDGRVRRALSRPMREMRR